MSGAELVPGDDWGNIIYMTMCMDQGSGQGLQARFCPLTICHQDPPQALETCA